MGEEFHERMKRARLREFSSQQSAAKAIGCSRATVAMWEKEDGTGSVSSEYLLPAAAAYKVRPEWITDHRVADGYPWTPRAVSVRAYDVRMVEGRDGINDATDYLVSEVDVLLSAGSGSVVPEFVETKFQLPFQAYWFDKFNAKVENVKLMKVHGSSMERTLFDGDRVVVHFADKRIVDGRVYALLIAGEAKVKRLFKLRDGSLRVVSDNSDKAVYPDDIVPPGEMSEVYVLGRVIDKSGSGGL